MDVVKGSFVVWKKFSLELLYMVEDLRLLIGYGFEIVKVGIIIYVDFYNCF